MMDEVSYGMRVHLDKFNKETCTSPITYYCKNCGTDIVIKDDGYFCPKCNNKAEWECTVVIKVE